MTDESAARDIANGLLDLDRVVIGPAQELNYGWFFPCIDKKQLYAGVFVNKHDGRALRVLASSPLERDPTLYDRGYMYDKYDLVILTVDDHDATVRTIVELGFVTIDVYYRNDRVYRVGRKLTEEEVHQRISTLPCVFTGSLVYEIDTLEAAREADWFTFRALECREKI